MKNKNEPNFDTFDSSVLKYKSDVISRYINTNAKTAFRISNECANGVEQLNCLTKNDSYYLLNQLEKYWTYQFYFSNKAYLLVAEQKLTDFSNHYNNSFLEDLVHVATPLFTIIKNAEQIQKPFLFVEESIVKNAALLVEVQTQARLTKTHYKDLPSGANALLFADNQFKNVCAKLFINQ